MRIKPTSKFDVSKIRKLNKIFIEKGWTEIEEYHAFFENFCKLLEDLDSKQTDLLIELTSDFLWVKNSDYYKYLKNTLLKLGEYPNLNLEHIFIVPLLAKSDRLNNKIKSSTIVAYSCQNPQLRHVKLFEKTKFQIVHDINKLPNPSKLEANKNPIILIDDFIGTGDTALEGLEEILSLKGYDNNTLFVASLVCQNEGVELIKNRGYNVLSDVVREKGISDRYFGSELIAKRKIMESIENLLAVDSKFDLGFRFGYKESEALVTMIRTPNNTFPLYWFEAKLNKTNKWKAPFPR